MSLLKVGQTITYHLVRKLIERIAADFHSKFPFLERDELVSEGNLVYLSAYDSYKESKQTEFSSWLATKIRWHYYTLIRKAQTPMIKIDTDLDLISTDEGTPTVVERPPTATREAEEVLLAFDALPRYTTPYQTRADIVSSLRRKGWTRTKIERAMAEVSRAYHAQES